MNFGLLISFTVFTGTTIWCTFCAEYIKDLDSVQTNNLSFETVPWPLSPTFPRETFELQHPTRNQLCVYHIKQKLNAWQYSNISCLTEPQSHRLPGKLVRD